MTVGFRLGKELKIKHIKNQDLRKREVGLGKSDDPGFMVITRAEYKLSSFIRFGEQNSEWIATLQSEKKSSKFVI